MSEDAKVRKSNNILLMIIGMIIVIIGVLVGIIFALRSNQTISDSFFESDENKYVLTENLENTGILGDAKVHTVANVEGDTITGMSIYYEFKSSDEAKEKFEKVNSLYREDSEEIIKNISLNDKYVIVEYNEDGYKDVSASNFKALIDFYEEYNNGGNDEMNENEGNNEIIDNPDNEENIVEE